MGECFRFPIITRKIHVSKLVWFLLLYYICIRHQDRFDSEARRYYVIYQSE